MVIPAIFTHEVIEASDWQATGTSDELQQSHPLLIVHLLHQLQEKKTNKKQERLKTILSYYYKLQLNESLLRLHTDLPEPDDLFTAASIVSVDGVSLPVYQVNLLHTTQHDLGWNTFSLRQKVYRPLHSWVFVFKHTSNSFASKYCRYCWGRTSLKPSKKACVCSSTPLDRRHSATSLHRQTQAQP